MPIKVLGPTHDRHPKNTRRENRLEELGRVDAEKAYTSKGKRNLRDEKHRIREELKNGGSSMPEHYLEHGYGPHKKRKGKAEGGVIKATKLIKGKPKIAKKGWK